MQRTSSRYWSVFSGFFWIRTFHLLSFFHSQASTTKSFRSFYALWPMRCNDKTTLGPMPLRIQVYWFIWRLTYWRIQHWNDCCGTSCANSVNNKQRSVPAVAAVGRALSERPRQRERCDFIHGAEKGAAVTATEHRKLSYEHRFDHGVENVVVLLE